MWEVGLILIVALISQLNYSVGDSIPYIPYINPEFSLNVEKPQICVNESHSENKTEIVKQAMNAWTVGLHERTGGNWDFGLNAVAENDCNVVIKFKTFSIKKPQIAGYIMFEFQKEVKKYQSTIVIYKYSLYEMQNKTLITTKTDDDLNKILQHELGHAFGLGHYNHGGSDKLENLAKKSIMSPYFPMRIGKEVKIQEDDYKAVIEKYGYDGWNGEIKIIPKYYIVSEIVP